MTSPIERALTLVDELYGHSSVVEGLPGIQVWHDLRSAIRDIGAWRKFDGSEATQPVNILVETKGGERLSVHYARGFTAAHRKGMADGDAWHPLAWKAADSTELPADWGTQ